MAGEVRLGSSRHAIFRILTILRNNPADVLAAAPKAPPNALINGPSKNFTCALPAALPTDT
jgi:hypothetical protein